MIEKIKVQNDTASVITLCVKLRIFSQLKANWTPWERPILVALSASLLTALLFSIEFNWLEAQLIDWRVRTGLAPRPDSRIVLVSLDGASSKAIGKSLPLSWEEHSQFLNQLAQLAKQGSAPLGVGYLQDLNSVLPSKTAFSAENFVTSARSLNQQGIPFLLGTPFEGSAEIIPRAPLDSLPRSLSVLHSDGNVFSEDRVTRRALTYLYDQATFHMEFSRLLGLTPAGKRPRGSYYAPEVDGQYFLFRYHGDPSVPIRGGDLPYDRISFVDILRGEIDPARLRGKILLVGSLNREDPRDYALTPFNQKGFSNPKLALHANILDSIIHDEAIVRASTLVNGALTWLVLALVFWGVLASKPMIGVLATLGCAVSVILVSWSALSFGSTWILTAQPLVGIFAGYYLVVPYRLIREYRTRWHYQQKNQILLQVEELKTNFLSLVTHDLKTPVARIQGLAEVLLRKASDRLIDRDRETIQHIIHSTEELNRFISTILELSKIESNRLQLQLESRDVNQLIEKTLLDFKAQARAHQVQLESNLEPLFPIKMDSSLIAKVLNNMVDNAIKYSPSGGTVRLSTTEVNSNGETRIEIRISDQGIGMSQEEQEKLFSKFYRAKNDTTTRISGTGLGLYLSRYFVEVHGGTLQVQSTPGQGTTFIIGLPIEAKPGLKVQLISAKTGEKHA
jgi:signal transduction histidine kinase